MSIDIVLQAVQQDLVRNLNAVYENAGLTALSYHDDAPQIGLDEHYMGIYLSSPEGEVFQSNGRSESITITLDCILDDVKENSNLPQQYLAKTIEYIRAKTYGISSFCSSGAIARVDLDASVNAFALAIDIVIAYRTDYDI